MAVHRENRGGRTTRLYNEQPDYRQLILGGKAPAEIKLSDRENDEAVASKIRRRCADGAFVK